jgi:hypothetical protein
LTDAQSSNDRLDHGHADLMKKQVATATPATNQENSLPQGLAALFGGAALMRFLKLWLTAMRSTMQDEVEGKMAGLKAKLNLTRSRKRPSHAILGKEMSQGMEVLEKLTKGELSRGRNG